MKVWFGTGEGGLAISLTVNLVHKSIGGFCQISGGSELGRLRRVRKGKWEISLQISRCIFVLEVFGLARAWSDWICD